MPRKKPSQPQIGNLISCRLQHGTFSYTTTRRVIQILRNGKRFMLEGKDAPIVEAKNILAVLTTISIS